MGSFEDAGKLKAKLQNHESFSVHYFVFAYFDNSWIHAGSLNYFFDVKQIFNIEKLEGLVTAKLDIEIKRIDEFTGNIKTDFVLELQDFKTSIVVIIFSLIFFSTISIMLTVSFYCNLIHTFKSLSKKYTLANGGFFNQTEIS